MSCTMGRRTALKKVWLVRGVRLASSLGEIGMRIACRVAYVEEVGVHSLSRTRTFAQWCSRPPDLTPAA